MIKFGRKNNTVVKSILTTFKFEVTRGAMEHADCWSLLILQNQN